MKVYEGNILTCDAQDRVYKYLVEDGGRIVYAGDELPAKYDGHTCVVNSKLLDILREKAKKIKGLRPNGPVHFVGFMIQ